MSQTEQDFRLERVPEPALEFANRGEAKDPRSGLLQHGPVPRVDGSVPEMVNVGIVGGSRSISMLEGLLRRMRTGIESQDKRKRWKHPFPGLGENSPLRLDYETLDKWKGRIRPDDLEDISRIQNWRDRIDPALRHVEYHIENVCQQTPPPDIVFVAIPERMIELCTDPNTDTDEIRVEDSDFRSRIKIAGMKHRTPTQLMLPKSLGRGPDVQEDSEKAWNLAVGMLYKAREGRPWKIARFHSQTCYAGISFFHERGTNANIRAAIAQVFIDDGTNFVIRGDPVEDIATDRHSTHLGYEDAKALVEQILEKYGNHRDDRPERFVLHKSSNFWGEESAGFSDGVSNIPEKDFITIRKRHPLRLVPHGDYPALRGTLVIPREEEEYYLYTTGYVPEQCVYNNAGTPNPIVIRPDMEHFTGDYRRVCEEIMSFSKLNWNSSDFCQREPVTTSIANDVGRILAEPEASEIDLQSHYYYYM